jgi:hypothetical protein
MDLMEDILSAKVTDAEDAPRVPVPNGSYRVRVAEIEVKTFGSGAKGVQAKFAILDEGDWEDRYLYECFVLRDKKGRKIKKSVARLRLFMETLGIAGDKLANFKFPEPDSGERGSFAKLLEEELSVTVEQEVSEKNGETYSRITAFTAPSQKAA